MNELVRVLKRWLNEAHKLGSTVTELVSNASKLVMLICKLVLSNVLRRGLVVGW